MVLFSKQVPSVAVESGMVGQALASQLAEKGQEVMIGTRSPEKLKEFQTQHPAVKVGTVPETGAFGEIVFTATKGEATLDVLQAVGAANLKGKILIDVSNPLDFSNGPPPKLALGHTDSAGEQIQRWISDAHVVKAFNIVGNADMVNPKFPGGPPDMFICGNDVGAKKKVTEILTAFGWSTIDLGAIEASRYIEPLAMVWITYGFRTNQWSQAFKLLRK